MTLLLVLVTVATCIQGATVQDRKGRFISMSNDEMFEDVLEELQDPLPLPKNSVSIKDHVMKKLKQQLSSTTTTVLPPLPTFNVATKLNVYNPIRLGQQMWPEPQQKPITESVFWLGGKLQQTSKPNASSEDLKIFWNSLGDVIQNTPFLPIQQINVPDLIAAMAAFFANSVPFVNRLGNANQPRPAERITEPTTLAQITADFPIDSNLLEYRQMASPSKKQRKPSKKRKNKPKSRRSTEKSFFIRSTEANNHKSSTTEMLKLFQHNNNPNSDAIRFKNMPITRKRVHLSDRELFNFKHSDISNSPIMILNMPSRPVLLYKLQNQITSVTSNETTMN